ncbi:MAG: hypothetical protein KF857_10625 [Fimbriimonadaceae bacterium]|nr:hypothetical protein [Fimbriimonadaceae bacterium]
MKNQNDLIAIIVAAVLAVGASAYFIFARRTPAKPAEPTQVPTAASQVPAGAVTYANSLPGGGGGSVGGRRGGPAGVGGGKSKWDNIGAGGPGAPLAPTGVRAAGK